MKHPKWSALLAREIPMRDGQLLRTLKHAADLTLNNKETGQRNTWQTAAQRLMTAAETNSKADIEEATTAVERALFMENRLKMTTERKS